MSWNAIQRWIFATLAFIALLLGCSRHAPSQTESDLLRSGATEMELVPPPVSAAPAEAYRERLPPQTAPKTLEQTLPAYPESALDDEVSCVARALYHIETDGRATLVRLGWEVPPPGPHLSDFESSIRDAVASWKFDPAKRLNRIRQPDGSIEFSTQVIPKAVTVRIRFRVEEGKAVVE